jgi:nitrite reductase/ring-hydroxylating ferredoxin subunit
MASPNWIKVAEPGACPEGNVLGARAGATEVVLACHDGVVSALGARCPHAGGPLAQGTIESGLLVCPWHGREFDLRTGAGNGCAGVEVYPVQVRADGIYVMAPTAGAT